MENNNTLNTKYLSGSIISEESFLSLTECESYLIGYYNLHSRFEFKFKDEKNIFDRIVYYKFINNNDNKRILSFTLKLDDSIDIKDKKIIFESMRIKEIKTIYSLLTLYHIEILFKII